MQPLQRVDGRTGARLDLERVLVELDRAEEVAAMRLEQTRARGEHRRPMPGIGAHGVGLVPERAFEHVPRAGEGRRADDPANARRIELTELPGLVERGARSLGFVQYVFEQAALLVQELSAALGAVRKSELRIEERQGFPRPTEEEQRAPRSLNGRQMIRQQRVRTEIGLARRARVAEDRKST